MRPVYQTILNNTNGNCMAACMASLLELRLDEVPNPTTATWWDDWQAWLQPRGLYMVEASGIEWTPPGYSILVGQSPRGDWQHAVVACNGEIVHDPHPDGGGVKTRTAYDLLVPLDPGANPLRAQLADLDRQRLNALDALSIAKDDIQRYLEEKSYLRETNGHHLLLCSEQRAKLAQLRRLISALHTNSNRLAELGSAHAQEIWEEGERIRARLYAAVELPTRSQAAAELAELFGEEQTT